MPERHIENAVSTIQLPITGGNRWHKRVVAYATVLNDAYTRDVLEKMSWHLNNKGYPQKKVTLPGGRQTTKYLHQLVYEHYHGVLPPGKAIDHIDRNPLNALPNNLRAATRAIQNANKNKQRNNTSGYHGVSWREDVQRWRAYVRVNHQLIHLGQFTCKHAAGREVNRAYRKHFSEVAIPNPEAEIAHLVTSDCGHGCRYPPGHTKNLHPVSQNSETAMPAWS